MKSVGLPFLTALVLLLAIPAAGISASTPGNWAPLKTERNDLRQVMKEAEIEIHAASGTIIVATTRPVQIKVFTILGRLVSNDTLPAGNHQLHLPAHGVYILQIGERTCKVAV